MGKILFTEVDGVFVLRFVGDVRVVLGPTINSFLDDLVSCKRLDSVVVDLTNTVNIDSTALGVLAKVGIRCHERCGRRPTIVSPNPDIKRVLITMGMDQLFVIATQSEACEGAHVPLVERPAEMVSEETLREQVLEAHRILMSMNEGNRAAFRDLVKALEEESQAHAPQRLAS